jgi:hypothetical protein
MNTGIFNLRLLARLGGSLLVCAATAGLAQNSVNVNVDAAKPINVFTVEDMGVYMDVYDTGATKPIIAGYLHAAGMYTMAYPGGYGSYPDLYHWSTNSGTVYENYKPPKDHFYPGENSMANFTNFLDKLGTAIIMVNYGSNLDGTGGGEPNEAAAWVAYANGDPASTQLIGKDSTGHDWKTVGYWATLRAQSPLDTDDGMNKLRAGHPKPLNIKLWQVGGEVYNNGYYGTDHGDEEDLHAPYPASDKDNEKRRKNPALSPKAYGEHVVEYSKAMKAVDPKIWVGAALNLAPDDYKWGSDWNSDVLKAACKDIDFESMVWRPGGDTLPPDWKTRDDASVLRAPEEKLGPIFKEVIYNNGKYCPAGHSPRLAFTQMSPQHWAKIEAPITDALFAADAFALLAESGTVNTDWNELRNPYFLSDDNEPGAGYYGAQMLHVIAFRPGSEFVTAGSNNSLLAVHATKRTDGGLGIMLINKDPKASAEVKVTVSGGTFDTQGMRFDYGQDILKAKGKVARAPVKVDGMTFKVSVPAYTITDIVLPKAQ